MDLFRLSCALFALPFLMSCGDSDVSPLSREPEAAPLEVYRFCESGSGQSRFFVHLDLVRESGDFRYQFMGQDIWYRASSVKVDGERISGDAEFENSRTGEVRATPFSFEFDWNEDTFQDGLKLFHCSPLQDVSLLQFPQER